MNYDEPGLVEATHPQRAAAASFHAARYIRYGASPRGAQALVVGAKVCALLDGRFAVSVADLKKVAKATLRHRIIRNFEGEAEGVSTDQILDELLDALPERS